MDAGVSWRAKHLSKWHDRKQWIGGIVQQSLGEDNFIMKVALTLQREKNGLYWNNVFIDAAVSPWETYFLKNNLYQGYYIVYQV